MGLTRGKWFLHQNYSTAVVLELPELGCCKAAAPGQDLTLTVLADEEDLSVWMHITSGASKRPTFDEEISQGLAERFNLDLSIDFTRTFSSDYLIAPKTEEVLALSFKERIDADPWAAAYADVSPMCRHPVSFLLRWWHLLLYPLKMQYCQLNQSGMNC